MKYPSQPRLAPDGSHVICDQCGKTWSPGKGESANCAECSIAFAEMEKKKHTWGPVSHNKWGNRIRLCARCGLQKIDHRTTKTNFGWQTVYLFQEGERATRHAPPCKEID